MILHTQDGKQQTPGWSRPAVGNYVEGVQGPGAPHLFPQCLLTIKSPLVYPKAPADMGFPGPGPRDMDNRVESQGRREPGPGWGTDAPRNQTQDFCLFGPLPFPKHP